MLFYAQQYLSLIVSAPLITGDNQTKKINQTISSLRKQNKAPIRVKNSEKPKTKKTNSSEEGFLIFLFNDFISLFTQLKVKRCQQFADKKGITGQGFVNGALLLV